MADAAPIVGDLAAESDELDGLVAGLPGNRWRELTPAAGWTIAHQIGHLQWTDRVALRRAISDLKNRGRLVGRESMTAHSTALLQHR